MRHGRAKLARKTLKFFNLNFDIKPPYHVLVDGNFLMAIVQQKVPIHDRLRKTLQNEEFHFYVCRSALDELALLAESRKNNRSISEAFYQARQFGLDECTIIESKDIPNFESSDDHKELNDQLLASSFSTPGNDIHKLVLSSGLIDMKKYGIFSNTNIQGFLVATQDGQLSDILREIPKVLLIRLSRGVLILESPSSASRKVCMYEERGKQSSGGGTMTDQEKELVKSLLRQKRKSNNNKTEIDEYQQRKKKKARGPNPLSCKSSKKKHPTPSPSASASNNEIKKRRRRKKVSA